MFKVWGPVALPKEPTHQGGGGQASRGWRASFWAAVLNLASFL
jgi:hypothetical protein